MRHSSTRSRSRWAAIGAAVAVAMGGTGLLTASASVDSGERTVFVPITPCRLLDTRPAPDNVGGRATPLGAGDTLVAPVRGTNGNCTIPSDAVAVSLNVVIIDPTASSYLTVFPSDAPRPLSSSLNWVARQAPTPNAVTVDLSTDGSASFFNLAGTVHVAADVVGYYADHRHDDRYFTKVQTEQLVADQPGWASRIEEQQVVFGRWWEDPARPLSIPVGTAPANVVFDGSHVWVSNAGTGSVTKVDADTGAIVGTYPTGGTNTGAIVYDGTYIWAINNGTNTVSKLVAATGAPAQGSPLSIATSPSALVFDGNSVWVSDFTGSKVVDIDPLTNVATNVAVPGGSQPNGMVFDGTHVWVALTGSNSVVSIDPATRSVGSPAAIGVPPLQLVFDGTYLWASGGSGSTVVKLDGAGTVVANVVVTGNPSYLAYDGSYVWVTATGTPAIVRIHAASADVVSSKEDLVSPRGMAFDGRNMWVVDNGGTLHRLVP